ncbi:MAG TPA: hypothetical protein VN203_21560, partial [Candidatus Acidoferrum sp.]|nr:hypothetical protein [Candidatus Acidoferrum sp.]
MSRKPSTMMSPFAPEIPDEGHGLESGQRGIRSLLAYAISCAIACLLIQITSGVFLYIFAAVGAVTFVFVIREAGVFLAQACGRRMAISGLNRLALVVAGLMGSLVVLEAGLHFLSLFTTVPRWAPRVGTDLVMPEAWKRRRIHIEGT